MTDPHGVPGSFPSGASVPLRPSESSRTEQSAATAPQVSNPGNTARVPSISELNRTNSISNAWSVYTLTKEIRPDGLQKLTGAENYRAWRDLMRLLLKNLYLNDCLTDLMDIRATDNPETIGKLTLLQGRCFTYLLQSIDPSLHHFIITHQSPRAIWQALENQYDRQNNMNIHKQFQDLFTTKYAGPTASIKDHIAAFELKWTTLASRTEQSTGSDTNKLAYALKPFFKSSEIKASLLLGSLPDSMSNIIENLQTKDNLTYELAYNHLMDLRSASFPLPSSSSSETAYKGAQDRNRKSDSASGTESGTRSCSYCQKKGHLWSECRARKRREENKKDENKKKTTDKEKMTEKAKVADEDDESETALTVRPSSCMPTSPIWVLDSGATSHMTSHSDCFVRMSEKSGFVKIGDGSRIRIEGIGDVRLENPFNANAPIVLRDCLYVPSLGNLSLLSVRKCQKNGFHVVGRDDILEVKRPKGSTVCLGKDVGNGLFELQFPNGSHVSPSHDESAMVTYREWHKALGHPAFIAPTLYADGDLIPSKPLDFHCK